MGRPDDSRRDCRAISACEEAREQMRRAHIVELNAPYDRGRRRPHDDLGDRAFPQRDLGPAPISDAPHIGAEDRRATAPSPSLADLRSTPGTSSPNSASLPVLDAGHGCRGDLA
jgi:hypothetical protein